MLALQYNGQAGGMSIQLKKNRAKKYVFYSTKNRNERNQDGFSDCHMFNGPAQFSRETYLLSLCIVNSLGHPEKRQLTGNGLQV